MSKRAQWFFVLTMLTVLAMSFTGSAGRGVAGTVYGTLPGLY